MRGEVHRGEWKRKIRREPLALAAALINGRRREHTSAPSRGQSENYEKLMAVDSPPTYDHRLTSGLTIV